MRIDSFLLGCGLLLSSLLAMFLGGIPVLGDVAYVGILLSLGVMAADDWLDWVLIKLSSPRAARRPAKKPLSSKTA